MSGLLFAILPQEKGVSCFEIWWLKWSFYIQSETFKGLRPAGGVKHSDSDLVETRMLSAKKALR